MVYIYGYSPSTWADLPNRVRRQIIKQREASNANDKVAQALSKTANKISNRFESYRRDIEDALDSLPRAISRTIPGHIDYDLPHGVDLTAGNIAKKFEDAYDTIKDETDGFLDKVASGVNSLKNSVTGLIPDIPLPDLPGNVASLVSSIGGKLTDVFSAVKNRVSGLISSVEDGVKSLAGKVKGIIPDIDISLGSIRSSISSGIGGFLGDVKSGIGSIVSRVNSFASNVANQIGNKLSSFKNKIQNFGESMVSSVQDGIESFGTKVKSFGQNAIDTVESGIGTVADKFKSAISGLTGVLEGLGGAIFTALKTALTFLIDQIRTLLEFTGKVAHEPVEELRGIE